MAVERKPQQPFKEKGAPTKPEKAGRSGEGTRGLIPLLKADRKARAVARIAKRKDTDL